MPKRKSRKKAETLAISSRNVIEISDSESSSDDVSVVELATLTPVVGNVVGPVKAAVEKYQETDSIWEAERDRAEAERKAKEEAEAKRREEAEAKRKARAEAERKAREEAERKRREEAEQKAKEEEGFSVRNIASAVLTATSVIAKPLQFIPYTAVPARFIGGIADAGRTTLATISTVETVIDVVQHFEDKDSKANEKPASAKDISGGSATPPQNPKNDPKDPKDKDEPKPEPPKAPTTQKSTAPKVEEPKTEHLSLEGEKRDFSGHRGFEMKNPKYQEQQSKPEIIEGRQYTGHALDQMRNRGIPFSVVKDTIQSGTKSASREGTSIFYNAAEKIQVIIDNTTGNVITIKFGKL